jgi:type I site-specific restriction endonuclease
VPRNEAQTRFELVNPVLFARGWNTENIKVEATTGGIDVVGGRARRHNGHTDYLLRLQVGRDLQPVAIALIEAKPENKSPGFGLEQGKRDGDCDRLNVKFIFSTNGHQYVEYYDLSDIKVGKRTPFTLDRFDDFFTLLPEKADSERSWTVSRKALEDKGLDLKAVNPNRVVEQDTRTPEELIALIEEKQNEIEAALAELKRIRSNSPFAGGNNG